MTTCHEVDSKDQVLDDVIINGSTWAAIWHMAWPLLLQMSSVSIASFCDVWVAGKLGSDTQAAIGICGQIWFFMILMTVALSSGTTALVSRYWGARNMDMAQKAANQSMVFGFIFGICSALLGLAVARPLISMLGASANVQELGWQYMRVDMLSQLPFTICWVAHSIWRAKGNTRVPMINWVVMTLIIIALDFSLCIHPFQLGIAGIGYAWVVAAVVGMALNLVLLGRTELKECADLRTLFSRGINRHWFTKILRIGIPACIMDLAWVGGSFALFAIFARTVNPTACQASWAVGFRLEEIVSCLPLYALGAAVGPIVGQNLGALQPERAETAGWQVSIIGLVFTGFIAFVLFFGAQPIAQLMSSDKTVVAYSTQYFQVIGLSQPFVSLWIILFGAMQGAGYTAWPMWAGVIVLTLLRLPLAWVLTGNADGPMGCWIGIACSSTVLGILAVWRYRTGIWKLVKV
ncbi:MAG: MATE family efflux transporter [Candidatus Obscuribacterales bacterium]|nr:MATE family efflux transporter [Candidatus Obscuribacterales bacterium]